MSFAAVLFDMDGVLVDSEPVHTVAVRTVLERRGHHLSDVQYAQYFLGRTDKEGFARYFEAFAVQDDVATILQEKAQTYLALAPEKMIPCPGVMECIADLSQKEIPLALVTGSIRADATRTLQSLGLVDVFRQVIVAEDVTHSKPHPEGYLQGAGRLQVRPEDCLVVEDVPENIRALREAGIRSVGVNTAHNRDQLTESGAVLVFDNLSAGCFDSLL